jgi:hypothetical protein
MKAEMGGLHSRIMRLTESSTAAEAELTVALSRKLDEAQRSGLSVWTSIWR